MAGPEPVLLAVVHSVGNGVAVLADNDDLPSFPKAVGHLLGSAARSAQPIGEIGSGERLREIAWEETGKILSASEEHRVHDLDQSAFYDGPSLATPRSIGGVTPMLLLHGHEHFDLQVVLSQEIGEAHQFGEDVGRPAVFRGPASAEDRAVVLDLDNPLVDRNRVNDAHAVPETEKRGDLPLHRREASRLYLDQKVPSNEVDHKSVDGDLDAIPRPGIPSFQRCVEWLLPKGVSG